MSASHDGPTSPLSSELDQALRQATNQALSALTSLRRGVRQHVRIERDRGTTLSEIELDLRALVARAQERLAPKDGGDGGDGHHDALSALVIKWSKEFYAQNR